MTETTKDDPDAGAREALRLAGADPQNWVPAKDGIDHNVVIVGGGQTGAAFAFALRRAGIGGVSVIDAAPDEAHAGVWLNGARMRNLRTPKNLIGPELGIAGLGFQPWYEARHGRDAYEQLVTIPRTAWADYLGWYRRFLAIPVRYGARLVRIEPVGGHLRLHIDVAGEIRTETTRKLILANGFAASGRLSLPPVLARLPKAFVAHTAQPIDFAALQGKSVAIIGAAASAFDAAAAALEAGAAEVRLFARRSHIAALPVSRARGYPGAYDNYPTLPDAFRWRQALRYRRSGSTPPAEAVARAVAFPNFHIHLAAPWHSAAVEGGQIVAHAGGGIFHADLAIAATGFVVDPAARPELADIAPDILLWRDRFTPPADEQDDSLAAHPYLGTGHQFLEKVPGSAPHLRDIHVFDLSGFVSFGLPVGDVPSMKRGIPAVVAQISRDLFLDDFDHHARRMTGPVAADFDETLFASALRQAQEAAAE
jgi:cation diffusion facilitator CzcD-associated flavoprotein CzcO